MAVGKRSVNPPKNLRSRDGHDLGHMIDVDFIDQILIFDDRSNLLVKGFIVRSSNFIPGLQL